MSTIGSSLSKGEDGTPLINPNVLNQISGIQKDFTRAAFNAAVTQERANISNNGTGIWNAGEKLCIFGEYGIRTWFVGTSASFCHARNVSYLGKNYLLASELNVFGPTIGAPLAGSNGDYAIDLDAGLIYGPKTNGTWPTGQPLFGSTSGIGYNPRGPWAAGVNYNAGDVVTYAGSSYVVTVAYTSGSTFAADSSHLLLQAQAGAIGPVGATGAPGAPGVGFTFRGPWVANATYSVNDVVTYGGQTYISNAIFTAGNTFDTSHLVLAAAKGADGSGSGGSYNLPIAGPSQLGGILSDGSTLVIGSTGVASVPGVAYVNLSAAPYNAPLDGQPHTMTQAAALAMYPNCGATASIAQDTAAWFQAEYDCRTSVVRRNTVIWLPALSTMVVSAQLRLQNASRVWFHCGPSCVLLTQSCGTTTPISVENGTSLSRPLSNFFMQAGATSVSPPGNAGGVAWTGFITGTSAIQFINCQGIFIHNVAWNGYDDPIIWGNHVFGIRFINCAAGGNNRGLGWKRQAFGLDSMEAIYFIGGSLSNNNWGYYFDAIFGPNEAGTYFSQGGSVFLEGNSIDYNVIRQGVWNNAVNNYAVASLHITKNHIETTGACSGNTLSRFLSNGSSFFSHNELCENDGNSPLYLVQVADNTICSMILNRVNSTTIALMGSPTTGPKIVYAYGNVMQYTYARPIALLDGNGTLWQPSLGDGCSSQLIFSDPNPLGGQQFYGATDILCDYFAGPQNLTLDFGGWPSGATLRVWCMNNPVTLQVKPGAVLKNIAESTGPFTLTVPGTFALLRQNGPTQWIVIMPPSGGSSASIATVSQAGLVKPGSTMTITQDGTLDVVGISVPALPAGSGISGADLFAIFSNSANNDVRYTMSQIAAWALQNIPNWTDSTRPAVSNGQTALGFNSTETHLELIVGGTSSTTLNVLTFASSTVISFPSLTLTGAVFESTSPIYGAKSLKGGAGTGSGTVTVPGNGQPDNQCSVCIRGWFKGTAAGTHADAVFLTLTFPGNNGTMRLAISNSQIVASTGGSAFVAAGPTVRDGAAHYFNFQMVCSGYVTYSSLGVSGTAAAVTSGGSPPLVGGSVALAIDMTGLLSTDMIDNIEVTLDHTTTPETVPSGAYTRNSNTLALYNFDNGDGTGS